MIYCSTATIAPESSGWIVAWMSSELVQSIPQWPRLRVVGGQAVTISIEPGRGRFGLVCNRNLENVHVTAVIEPDEQPEDKRVDHLLPFPRFAPLSDTKGPG